MYFNLSFDDIHPESSKDGTDCGGDMEKGVFKYFLKLWKQYPELKITLFVTPNWIDRANDPAPIRKMKHILRLKYNHTWDDEPFNLTKHKEWCKWLNSFKNLEICVHGYNHHQDIKSHSQEFQDMPYGECKTRLEAAERVFKASGVHYVKGFRPPGWGISEGLFKALKDLKYDFVSLSPEACKINTLSKYKVEKYKGLTNIPQNWDIASGIVDEAVDIAKKHGLLMAKGHISDYYDGERIGNGLNEKTCENIIKALEAIKEYQPRFVSMKEICKVRRHG